MFQCDNPNPACQRDTRPLAKVAPGVTCSDTGPLPLALHVGSSSVPIEHGIVGGLLHSFAVQLDGLRPQLAGKGLVGLLLDPLQVRGQLHLGAAGEEGSSTGKLYILSSRSESAVFSSSLANIC